MKFQDLEYEWTQSWNQMMDYASKHPDIFKKLQNHCHTVIPPRFTGELHAYYLSKNYNLTLDFIKDHPDILWNFAQISKHKNITFDIVNRNPEIPWAWEYLMHNPNITPEFIIEHEHLPWKLSDFSYAMSENPNLTYDCMKKYKNYIRNDIEFWWSHPNITLDILKHHEREWHMDHASGNPNLTIKYVNERHCNMVENEYAPGGWIPNPPETLLDDWDWDEVWSFIKDFTDFDHLGVDYLSKERYRGYSQNGWGKDALSSNSNVPWEIIEKYHDQPWDWELLSKHPSVTWDNIQENRQFPWVEKCFLANPNLTWEFIQSNETLYNLSLFNGEELSLNPNITPHIVLGYPEINWDINMLVKNHMEKGHDKWIREQRLRHIKAFQIQHIWRKRSCDPIYPLAQRLLLYRYDN